MLSQRMMKFQKRRLSIAGDMLGFYLVLPESFNKEK